MTSTSIPIGTLVAPEETPSIVSSVITEGGYTPEETALNITNASDKVYRCNVSIYGLAEGIPSDCIPWTGSPVIGHYNYVAVAPLTVSLSRESSLFLQYMRGSAITIDSATKHVMILDCCHLTISLPTAPIAGLYLLRCKQVKVVIAGKPLGYLGCENSYECSVGSRLEEGFTLSCYGSSLLEMNAQSLPINVFTSGTWRLTMGESGSHFTPFHVSLPTAVQTVI